MMRKMNEDERDALEKSYFDSFRPYSNQQLAEAIRLFMDSDESYYPPKAATIRKFIPGDKDSKHDGELVKRFTCVACGEKVSAISDGRCLDCAGMPPADPDHVHLPETGEDNFVIEGRRRCNDCGAVAMCIEEPKGCKHWQCQKCYAGIDRKEVGKRFNDLQRMMGDKDYTPAWVERTPYKEVITAYENPTKSKEIG